MRRPPRSLYLTTTLFLLALALGIGGSPSSAQAASRAPAASHQIDWAHPFRGGPPAATAPHSGLVTALPGSQTALAVQPAANFPSGCYQGIAYNVIVQGHTSWTAQKGNQKATVFYQWCPRWSGDSVGLNWSYGKITQLAGCADIAVGGPIGSEVGGAFLAFQGPWPDYVNDGEPVTTYSTCAGQLVWDYSLTDRGDGLYQANMEDSNVSVSSPCYC
jgi:hypothetical protein